MARVNGSEQTGLPEDAHANDLWNRLQKKLDDFFRVPELEKQETGIIPIEIAPGKTVTLVLGDHMTKRDPALPPMPFFLEDTARQSMTFDPDPYAKHNSYPYIVQTMRERMPIVYIDINHSTFNIEEMIYGGEYAGGVGLVALAILFSLIDKKITRSQFCMAFVGALIVCYCALRDVRYVVLNTMITEDQMSPENLDSLEKLIQWYKEIQFLTLEFRNLLFAYKIKYAFEKLNLTEAYFPVGAFHVELRTLLLKSFEELEELIRSFYSKHKMIVDHYILPEDRVILHIIAAFTPNENGEYETSPDDIHIIEPLREIFEG